jgi:hypothetical protein
MDIIQHGIVDKKYIIYILHSVFIHRKGIDVILGVARSVRCVVAGCEGSSCSVSDLDRPPVEWTLAVARMVGQQTSVSGLLRSVGLSPSWPERTWRKSHFRTAVPNRPWLSGFRKQGQDELRTGAYHSLWTQPCANGTMWHTEVLKGGHQ